jgi:antitoxin YefM
MKTINYTAARENFAAAMNEVCQDRIPILITRNRDQAVVLISLEEYEAMEATAHLLRNPANARRLLNSIEQLETGKGNVRHLDLV